MSQQFPQAGGVGLKGRFAHVLSPTEGYEDMDLAPDVFSVFQGENGVELGENQREGSHMNEPMSLLSPTESGKSTSHPTSQKVHVVHTPLMTAATNATTAANLATSPTLSRFSFVKHTLFSDQEDFNQDFSLHSPYHTASLENQKSPHISTTKGVPSSLSSTKDYRRDNSSMDVLHTSSSGRATQGTPLTQVPLQRGGGLPGPPHLDTLLITRQGSGKGGAGKLLLRSTIPGYTPQRPLQMTPSLSRSNSSFSTTPAANDPDADGTLNTPLKKEKTISATPSTRTPLKRTPLKRTPIYKGLGLLEGVFDSLSITEEAPSSSSAQDSTKRRLQQHLEQLHKMSHQLKEQRIDVAQKEAYDNLTTITQSGFKLAPGYTEAGDVEDVEDDAEVSPVDLHSPNPLSISDDSVDSNVTVPSLGSPNAVVGDRSRITSAQEEEKEDEEEKEKEFMGIKQTPYSPWARSGYPKTILQKKDNVSNKGDIDDDDDYDDDDEDDYSVNQETMEEESRHVKRKRKPRQQGRRSILNTFNLDEMSKGIGLNKTNDSIFARAHMLADAVLRAYSRLNSEALNEERERLRVLQHSLLNNDEAEESQFNGDGKSSSKSYATGLGYTLHSDDDDDDDDDEMAVDAGVATNEAGLNENDSLNTSDSNDGTKRLKIGVIDNGVVLMGKSTSSISGRHRNVLYSFSNTPGSPGSMGMKGTQHSHLLGQFSFITPQIRSKLLQHRMSVSSSNTHNIGNSIAHITHTQNPNPNTVCIVNASQTVSSDHVNISEWTGRVQQQHMHMQRKMIPTATPTTMAIPHHVDKEVLRDELESYQTWLEDTLRAEEEGEGQGEGDEGDYLRIQQHHPRHAHPYQHTMDRAQHNKVKRVLALQTREATRSLLHAMLYNKHRSSKRIFNRLDSAEDAEEEDDAEYTEDAEDDEYTEEDEESLGDDQVMDEDDDQDEDEDLDEENEEMEGEYNQEQSRITQDDLNAEEDEVDQDEGVDNNININDADLDIQFNEAYNMLRSCHNQGRVHTHHHNSTTMITPDVLQQLDPHVMLRIPSRLLLSSPTTPLLSTNAQPSSLSSSSTTNAMISKNAPISIASSSSSSPLVPVMSTRRKSHIIRRPPHFVPLRRLYKLLSSSTLHRQMPLHLNESVLHARIRTWSDILVKAIVMQQRDGGVSAPQDAVYANQHDNHISLYPHQKTRTTATTLPTVLRDPRISLMIGEQERIGGLEGAAGLGVVRAEQSGRQIGRGGRYDLKLLKRLIARAVEMAILQEEKEMAQKAKVLSMENPAGFDSKMMMKDVVAPSKMEYDKNQLNALDAHSDAIHYLTTLSYGGEGGGDHHRMYPSYSPIPSPLPSSSSPYAVSTSPLPSSSSTPSLPIAALPSSSDTHTPHTTTGRQLHELLLTTHGDDEYKYHKDDVMEGAKDKDAHFHTSSDVASQMKQIESRIKSRMARDVAIESDIVKASILLDQATTQQLQQLKHNLSDKDQPEFTRRIERVNSALQAIKQMETQLQQQQYPQKATNISSSSSISSSKLKHIEDELKIAYDTCKQYAQGVKQRIDVLTHLSGGESVISSSTSSFRSLLNDLKSKINNLQSTLAPQVLQTQSHKLPVFKHRINLREALSQLDPSLTAKMTDTQAQTALDRLISLVDKVEQFITETRLQGPSGDIPELELAKKRILEPAKPPVIQETKTKDIKQETKQETKVSSSASSSSTSSKPNIPAASSTPAPSPTPTAAPTPSNPILAHALALNAKYTQAEKIYQKVETQLAPEVMKEVNKLRRKCTSTLVKVSATMESVNMNIKEFRGLISDSASVAAMSSSSASAASSTVNANDIKTYLLLHTARELVAQGDSRPSAHAHYAFFLSQLYPDFLPLLLASFHIATVLTIPNIPPPHVDTQPELRVKRLRMKLSEDGTLESMDDFLNRVYPTLVLYMAFMSLDMTPYLNGGASIRHPHGLGECWTWIATVVNNEPCFCTATMLEAFLNIAGGVFLQQYPNQGRKIMHLIGDSILPRIEACLSALPKNVAQGAAGLHLKRIIIALEHYHETGTLEIPANRSLSATSGVGLTFSAYDIESAKGISSQ